MPSLNERFKWWLHHDGQEPGTGYILLIWRASEDCNGEPTKLYVLRSELAEVELVDGNQLLMVYKNRNMIAYNTNLIHNIYVNDMDPCELTDDGGVVVMELPNHLEASE
jgi:hypothetical protein